MEKVAPVIRFDNTERAYQAKSNSQLRQAYTMFRLINLPVLSRLGPWLLETAFRFKLPIEGIVHRTLFQLFCGGRTLDEVKDTARHWASYHVKTGLGYSVEAEKTEEGFEIVKNETINSLRYSADHPEIVWVAAKLTGLGSIELMEKKQAGESLSADEQGAYQRLVNRVDAICQAALDADTAVYIDAEETWIQEVIDDIAESMMAKYNTDRAIVYTTIQMYRKDRLTYLEELIAHSNEQNYVLGVKLVRGAYIEKETHRAEEMEYENPLQVSKEATDKDYNEGLALCVQNIAHLELCAATHNEDSCLLLTRLMDQYGVPHNHPCVSVAQLQGMAEHISYNLAHEGYNVVKYTPYGPVRSVIPYLIRRAEENSSVAGQSNRELELLRSELHRRKKLFSLL